MKMRKKLAALLAVAMIASVMPMTAFAASRNRVNKTITVEKDSVIKDGYEPTISVRLDDTLTTEQSFYLELDGAEWLGTDDLMARTGGVATGNDNEFIITVESKEFEVYREGDSTLAIRLFGPNGVVTVIEPEKNPNENFEFTFPMATKVTGAEAKVKVIMYDTIISNTEHLFAVAEGVKAKLTVGDAPAFFRTTEMAELKLEETYAKSISDVPYAERWFTIELRDTDFTFNVNDAKLTGERAYRGIEDELFEGETYRLSRDNTRLGIRVSNKFTSGLNERGIIKLSGVEVVAHKNAKDGDVIATIESNELFDKETITVAKRGDYKTKLSVADDWDYDVVAGTEKEVTFKLSEELANSLIGTRPVTFTFDQDVTIAGASSSSNIWKDWNADNILWGDMSTGTEDEIRDLLRAIDLETDPEKLISLKIRLYDKLNLYTETKQDRPGKDIKTGEGLIKIEGSDVEEIDEDWSKPVGNSQVRNRVQVADDLKSFTVDNFEIIKDKAASYTFTTTLKIPANVTGDIHVAVDGRGVDAQEITILKAEAPVTVSATRADIKVGLKEIETAGTITIKETKEGRLRQGKDIVLRIDDIDSGLKIKSFDYAVTEGDLELEDGSNKWKSGDQTISIKRSSTEASTIEITNIVMFTDRTVPEGKYDLLVGGNAISDNAHASNDIDEVAKVEDFINITTKNTEDISGSANKAVVAFVVGSDQYLVNGKAETMDTPPYIKDSNTMVPVRYVAIALGVDNDKVIWDQANQTATILADKVVQVKLGSKAMIVNGVNIPMTASAELTNDRTFVPMGAIARALGVVVEWDNDNKIATFNPAK